MKGSMRGWRCQMRYESIWRIIEELGIATLYAFLCGRILSKFSVTLTILSIFHIIFVEFACFVNDRLQYDPNFIADMEVKLNLLG